MPIYEFACPEGHVTERLASMDTETISCPECGEEAPRRMSAPAGFDLRGPGFYKNDYAPSRPPEGTGAAQETGDSGPSRSSGEAPPSGADESGDSASSDG